MNPKTISYNTKEYRNLEQVASALSLASDNYKVYYVGETYFDFGQNWKWTTILKEDDSFGAVQVLNPRQWEEIITATSFEQIGRVIDNIIK